MRTQLSPRDWEAISAYLDGQLSPKERAGLEERFKARADLRAALEEMRRTRAVLRSQPKLRAPRNFTLTPEMVGQRSRDRSRPRIYPLFGLASALATMLFVAVLLADLLSGSPAAVPSSVALQVTRETALEAPAAAEDPAQDNAEGATMSQRELPAQVTPEAAEEMMEAFEAHDPTVEAERLTEEAGMTATPLSTGEAYPPLAAAPGAEAESAGVPYPAPTISPTQPAPNLQMKEETAELQDRALATPSEPVEQERGGFWTPLRVAELMLALFAVASGLVWLTLRRMAGS